MPAQAASAYLVVPANNEFQVAHELPEGFVLREELLGAVWNLFLLLEVQIFHFSQDCHQLKGQGRAGNPSEGDLNHGPAAPGFSQPRNFKVGGWDVVLAGGLRVASPYEMDPRQGKLDIIIVSR